MNVQNKKNYSSLNTNSHLAKEKNSLLTFLFTLINYIMLKTPVLRARQGNKWLSQVTYCNANIYTIFISAKYLRRV